MILEKQSKLPNRHEALTQLQDFGLSVDHLDVDASSIKRVKFHDKSGREKVGFYRAFSIPGTDLVSGFFGSWWPSKIVNTFSGTNSYSLTQQQKFGLEKLKRSAERDVDNYQPDLSIWDMAEPCETHPYLERKGIKSYGLRSAGDELLIPQYDHSGKLSGIQRIVSNGTKLFVKGVKTGGASMTIPGSDVHALCEGYATGATIHEATGWTVVVCFSASNLKKVAGLYKTERLIVCGDNDAKTKVKTGTNPGLDAAREVAEKYHCPYVVPYVEEDGLNTDYNDLGVESTKAQIIDKAPLNLLDQVARLDDADERERFLIERKSLLADYPTEEFEFLKNRLKGEGISKGFMDSIIKGVLSETQLRQMDEAKAKLKDVRFDGKNYFKVDSKRFYPTSQQEVTLLTKIASNDNTDAKQKMLETIHRDQVVASVIAEAVPFGESYVDEFLGTENARIIKKMVSIQEALEGRLAELQDIEINDDFIAHIQRDYPEIIEIMEAGLARKFCQSKKTFVYLNCPTNYGKNFFFEIESLARTFTHSYEPDEFRGNSPEDFLKPIYFFIDEAEKFPAHYKINAPEYKRLYGGLTKVNLGMRILACANPMEDIERGVDPQLMQRIIRVKPKRVEFTHMGIEKNLSQRIWEKWILNHLSNLLNAWSVDGDFYSAAETHYEEFVSRHSDGEFMSLQEVLRDNLQQLMDIVEMGSSDLKAKMGFDFASHITVLHAEEDAVTYLIQSPTRFIKELFKYFDESRYGAFRKQYHSLTDYDTIPWLECKPRKHDGVTKKGITFSASHNDEILENVRLPKSGNGYQ